MSIEKLPESVKLRLTDKNLDRAKGIIEDCKRLGVGIMTYADSRYPRILKYISKDLILIILSMYTHLI